MRFVSRTACLINCGTDVITSISLSSQCSTTGGKKAVVCVILSGMMHIKESLLLIGKSSPCGYRSGPLPYVWRHITVNNRGP